MDFVLIIGATKSKMGAPVHKGCAAFSFFFLTVFFPCACSGAFAVQKLRAHVQGFVTVCCFSLFFFFSFFFFFCSLGHGVFCFHGTPHKKFSTLLHANKNQMPDAVAGLI
jgi:hypothetical protein